MQFITLTDVDDNEPIRVAVAHIAFYYAMKGGTRIVFGPCFAFVVKETPEQIDALRAEV